MITHEMLVKAMYQESSEEICKQYCKSKLHFHCEECCERIVTEYDERIRADGIEEGKRLGVIEALKPYDVESVEDLIQNVRIKTIEEIISTLAQSEDTILTDKQYYTLMGMKEGAE